MNKQDLLTQMRHLSHISNPDNILGMMYYCYLLYEVSVLLFQNLYEMISSLILKIY